MLTIDLIFIDRTHPRGFIFQLTNLWLECIPDGEGVILVFIEVVEWFFGNVVVISVAKFGRFAFTFFWIVPWLNFTGCPN